MAADQILVLNEGEVTERGSHDELIDQGGIYAELVKLQNVARRQMNLIEYAQVATN